jgi:type IV secretion system protein VirB9
METTHLIIKPLDVALETSLIVTTDRRVYHLKLKSHRSEYMSQISFVYPAVQKSTWIKPANVNESQSMRSLTSKVDVSSLSFDYHISGPQEWRPKEVYNDGKKTIIEMPDNLKKDDAPTLLVVRKKAGLFSSEETTMVNYRVIGNRYIVDSVFERAILISGVGSDQDRVLIERKS